MKISLIVAMGKQRQIGRNNQLLWHIPEDLKKFKSATMGHHMVMGRKTFESIGRPLPGRKTIILSRNQSYMQAGCDVVGSLDQAIDLAKKDGESELFIVGGGQIYQMGLTIAHWLYLTEVDYDGPADTYFPILDLKNWQCVHREDYQVATQKNVGWRYAIYERAANK